MKPWVTREEFTFRLKKNIFLYSWYRKENCSGTPWCLLGLPGWSWAATGPVSPCPWPTGRWDSWLPTQWWSCRAPRGDSYLPPPLGSFPPQKEFLPLPAPDFSSLSLPCSAPASWPPSSTIYKCLPPMIYILQQYYSQHLQSIFRPHPQPTCLIPNEEENHRKIAPSCDSYWLYNHNTWHCIHYINSIALIQ